MSGVNVRHIGLVVQNLEKMLDFYCKTLGFKLRSRQIEKGNYISSMLGLSQAEVETAKLYLEETGSLLELLYFHLPSSTHAEKKELHHLGLTHFAISIGDLDQLHQKMSSQGLQFVSPPVTTENNYAKVAFCQDPEGNYLELVQVL